MTTRSRRTLLIWLRDAHAMEQQAETMLTATAKRLENYPELQARIREHIEETRRQAAMVRSCIERLGGDTSTVKDSAAKMMAMAQGLSGMFVSDEVVKASLASYTFEHMEIASYRALIAAAQACGDTETQRICEEILPQEEAMANWLAERLPETVKTFMTREDTPGTTAKH